MEEYLDFALGIKDYAKEIMKKYFFLEENNIEYKEDRTPVTTADKLINHYLIEAVKKNYPTHGVCGEEEKYNENSKYLWVCDPIDGTSMYTRGVPVSTFSLAFVIDGDVKVGVVLDPFLDDVYTAIKGQGAYLNGEKINVNDKKLGEVGCSIDYCMWDKAKYDTLPIVGELRSVAKMFQVGSTVHASMLVARGKISAELFPGTAHGNCDIAASKLIVSEAGGVVTNFLGEDQRYDRDIEGAVLSNKVIHEELMEKVKKYSKLKY